MLWHDKRFRWGLFLSILAGLAWFVLAMAMRHPEEINADPVLVLSITGLVALGTTALGAALIVPVVRREWALEMERPAPTRDEAMERAFKWGVGMLIVSFVPLLFLGLFHFLGAGVIPTEAKIGPAIWALLIIVSGVLLIRGKRAGALLGAAVSALAGIGLIVSAFVAGGAKASMIIAFLLAFVAAPRLWKVARDLKRTS